MCYVGLGEQKDGVQVRVGAAPATYGPPRLRGETYWREHGRGTSYRDEKLNSMHYIYLGSGDANL